MRLRRPNGVGPSGVGVQPGELAVPKKLSSVLVYAKEYERACR